jgi:hypothetical protein
MRRSAKGHSRLTRMLPRHDVVLTGFALGTRRSLDAARFLVKAGRDEAAGNMERQALLFGEMQRPAVAGEWDEVADGRKGWPNYWRTTFRPPCSLPTSSHPRVTELMS